MKIYIHYERPNGQQCTCIAPDPVTAIKICEHIIRDNTITDFVSSIFSKKEVK